ncbi:MAG TPA: lipoate--protein ligase family protein [Pirellulaceae bacterium]|jgi:lipoate-protein ligase A
MKLLALTLATPAENLAADDALLAAAESALLDDDILRLWEMPSLAIVVGRSSRIEDEVNVASAEAMNTPILRRASGGCAIVAGPGCLMYSVILRYSGREYLRLIDECHRHVLGILRSALSPLISGIEHVGTSDLALNNRKFSGNSLRCKRDHLLYHGTILYNFNLNLISELLKRPPREPEYRAGRDHSDFVTNLPLKRECIRQRLMEAFGASEPLAWPIDP